MRAEFRSQLNDEQLEGLFHDLDLADDGILDVNELGQKLSKIYGPFVINEDKALWSKISKNLFIDTEKFKEKFEDVENLDEILMKINLEENPNITFWQFLRSKNTQERRVIEESIHAQEKEGKEGKAKKEKNDILSKSHHQKKNPNQNSVKNNKNLKKENPLDFNFDTSELKESQHSLTTGRGQDTKEDNTGTTSEHESKDNTSESNESEDSKETEPPKRNFFF